MKNKESDMNTNENTLRYVPFVVNEKPFACWDWNLKQKNLDFLNGIDTEYFKYIAETHGNNLNNKNKHRAALALRIAYTQALEVFFALIGSMIQAPNCIVGWMLSYTNSDLRMVINNINKQKTIYSKFNWDIIEWVKLAEFVHSFIPADLQKNWIPSKVGALWSRFSKEFLDKKNILEYNSAKHGLRTSLGGFVFSIGVEKEPGKPAPIENMKSIGGSEFGTSFFYREFIFNNNKVNFSPKNQSLNWNPENLANGLFLISLSINNVISALKIANGVDPKTCQFLVPDTEESLELPWKHVIGATAFNFNVEINPKLVRPITKEDILQSYSK